MSIDYSIIIPDVYMRFNEDTWVGMSNIAGWKLETDPLKVTLYTKDGRSVVSTDSNLIQQFKDTFEEYLEQTGGQVIW